MINKKLKKCEWCGKLFVAEKTNRKYCDRTCRLAALEKSRNRADQLCWKCQKATGSCSWSSELKPVEGWNAKKVSVRDGLVTYQILSCPLFVHD